MVYEIKCAWCGLIMGTRECEITEYNLELQTKGLSLISHGICPKCREKALEDIQTSPQRRKP